MGGTQVIGFGDMRHKRMKREQLPHASASVASPFAVAIPPPTLPTTAPRLAASTLSIAPPGPLVHCLARRVFTHTPLRAAA